MQTHFHAEFQKQHHGNQSHPTPAHHLKDSGKLGTVLKQYKINALLFGHNHHGKVWNGCWGIKRVYDAGSSTGRRGKIGPHRVIDLSKEPVFDYDAKFWQPCSRACV